ncbi:MAG: right-handed parallel beta-helix repeat-containing protein [Actinobacteria bacterium]|nr:right-handed parallel beta-helix repeat-containing protein [Actinomycetota bacterium]
MQSKWNNGSIRARGPGSRSRFISYVFLIMIALLAGLVFYANPAQAVSTVHILNDENGGMCRDMGWTWDPETRTCTMTGSMELPGADAIHVEGEGLTLDGAGYTITGNGLGNGVTVGSFRGVTVRNIHIFGYSLGITAASAPGATVLGNEVMNCATGIYMNGSIDALISTNTLTSNGHGVNLGYGSENNLVTMNTMTSNSIGAYVFVSNDSTFTFNTIESSSSCGVSINYSTGNAVYNNMLTGNATQAEVVFSSNIFDMGPVLGGNYWSDWAPPAHPDGDGDGFVDDPYVFSGGQDNYPLASPTGWDQTAPVVENTAPNGTIRNGNPTITASYSDQALSSGMDTGSAAVVFTDSPNQAPDDYVCAATGSPDGTITCAQQGSPVNSLTQGHYEFQVSIKDNEDNTGTASGSFDIQAYRISDTVGGQDCTLFGIWDADTKTCTMTSDLNVYDLDGLYIQSNGITLDGNGHSLTNTDTLGSLYWGAHIESRTGVTIKDLTVSGFYAGIFLPGASGNTISGNHLNGNTIGALIPYVNAPGGGIYRPSDNTVIGNDMSSNSYAGLYFIKADNNKVVDNTFTGNTEMCVIADADDGAENHGLTFSGNTCSGSPDGFQLWRTHESRFVGNSVAPGTAGKGFALNKCDGNIFERNVILGESASGFTGFADEGMSPDNDANQFYSNSFIKTTFPYQFTAFNLGDAGDSGNTFTREFGGGNYYSWRDNPGEGCSDVDPTDGFCDTPYVFSNGQDNRPWTIDGAWAPDYYWTWYDNLYADNWVLMANPLSAPADSWFDLEIAGDDLDPGTLEGLESGQVPPGSSLTPAYPGTMGGPTSINQRGPGQAITSQRILWAGNSIEEVLGMDVDRLSDHYYWTWYDEQSAGYKNWVMVANPDPVHDAYAEVRIAGTVRWSGAVIAGGNVTPNFPGVLGGPVEVQAWVDEDKTAPADVLASQRVLMNGDTAFNELPGTPAGELSDHYIWTWYDYSSPGAQNWVMLANPKAYPIYYEVKVAGVSMGSGELASAGQTGSIAYPAFAGEIGGPVEVHFWKDAVGGSLITEGIASQRVLWGPSFGELPGYPYTALDSTYHWTWYDWNSPGSLNWIMAAPDPAVTEPVRVEFSFIDRSGTLMVVRAGSCLVDSDDPDPDNRRCFWSYPGYKGGPVQVRAVLEGTSTPAKVIASQRVLWNGFFNEVPGTVLN